MENEKAHICGDPFGACDAECMEKAMMTESERSNFYQRQMRTWREAALSATAERDQLRADNEESKEQSVYWQGAAIEMRGYKEAAERERDEAWKMAHSVRETLQDVRNQRDAAQAHAEDLRGALGVVLRSAFPHPVEHPTMTEAWKIGEAAIDRTPAQSLGRIKSEALREFAKSREVEVVGNGEWYAGIEAERIATVGDLRDTADRLEKEVTNGTN